jgi:hypothetical protein
MLSCLHSIAGKGQKEDLKTVIAGDLNGLVNRLDEFTLSNNFKQIVDFKTRLNNTLDIFLTDALKVWHVPDSLAPLANSDHSIISVKAKRNQPKAVITWIKFKRIMNYENMRSFGSELATIDWSFLKEIKDVTACTTAFYNVILPLMHAFFPLKRIKMREDDKPWITYEIKDLMNMKDKAFKKGDHGLVLIIQQRLNRSIEKALHKRTKMKICKSSLKDKWRFVKNCISKKKCNSASFTMESADAINTKFCSVFKADDISQFDVASFSSICEHVHPTIETFETFIHLKKIKSFAEGPDNISGKIYKSFAEFLAEPLTIIFNLSILHHQIPQLWKMANVVPIPKSKDEYRPISLLCHPIKILEKIVLSKWLIPSLKKHFCPTQFAFIPNVKYGGCCNALTLARVWTLKGLDEGAHYIRWLAIDFKKAFDTVSHKTILNTLTNHFHVNNCLVLWLYDYFIDRVQGVVVNTNSTGPYLSCSSGVPQGSILGPVLFALLLDPCQITCPNSKLVAYADDCTIMHKVLPGGQDTLQVVADDFIGSAAFQGLEINPEKCQLLDLHYSNAHPITPPTLHINSTQIHPEECIKILGVFFTSDLGWNTHLNQAFRKAARASYLIKLLHKCGVKDSFLWTIAQSLVFSHLSYCWPVICDCTLKDLNPFILLEKRIAKICNVHLESSLKSRLDSQCVRLAKKISSCSNQHPLEECFQRNPSTCPRNLRKTKRLLPLFSRRARLRNSFTKFAC